MFSPFLSPRAPCCRPVLLCAGVNAQAAGFLEDSSAKVEARNVYFNRDFRDGHSSSSQGRPSEKSGPKASSSMCSRVIPKAR
jgi:hypothetical protein